MRGCSSPGYLRLASPGLEYLSSFLGGFQFVPAGGEYDADHFNVADRALRRAYDRFRFFEIEK